MTVSRLIGIYPYSKVTPRTRKHSYLDIVKRLFVGDVIYEHDAHGPAVVGGSDGAEALLAGGVPDLKLDLFAVHFNGPDLEVDPYCRYEG